MINPLGAAYEALTADTELMALVTGGVSTVWNISTAQLPRIILGYDTMRIDQFIRAGKLNLDLFFVGNVVEAANTIKNLCVSILESIVYDTDETGETLRFYYETDNLITEDNPDIGHLSVIFDIRFARKLLI